VSTESVVAVVMERSADLLVAQLAVLKAGGAYLPIALADPADRIAFMVEDADAVCALTTMRSAGTVPAGLPAIVLDDPDTVAELSQPVGSVSRRPRPHNRAYVMYTSGSTGLPKGVVTTHQGIVDLVADPFWQLTPASRVLFHAPHAFDASTYEIWGPLCAGARVVVAPPDREIDG